MRKALCMDTSLLRQGPISMYLYNKNVLEYAQIARSGPKSMIRNIEGRSTVLYLVLRSPIAI